MKRLCMLVVAGLLGSVGCGGSSSDPDGSVADLSVTDLSMPDGSVTDGSVTDLSVTDADIADADVTDGSVDADLVDASDDATVQPALSITSLSPSFGPNSGGTVVTITGTGLTAVSAVTFGATPAASFTVDSDTSITATAPAGTGVVDVTVTTPVETSSALSYLYDLVLVGAHTFNTDSGLLDGAAVPAGTSFQNGTWNVSGGITFAAGSTLTLQGSQPFDLEAVGPIVVTGTIDGRGARRASSPDRLAKPVVRVGRSSSPQQPPSPSPGLSTAGAAPAARAARG